MSLVRVLHMDIATSIELREYLRLHRDTIRQIQSPFAPIPSQEQQTPSRADFLSRLNEIYTVLDHFERMVETTREQLDNLLSLVCTFVVNVNLMKLTRMMFSGLQY
jgi:hypothetical protein